MKKLLLLTALILVASAASLSLDAKPKKKESKEIDGKSITILDPREWATKVKWDSPKRCGFSAIDSLYDRGDELYAKILYLSDSIVFFDVKMVANAQGDTIVAVVDRHGNLRDKNASIMQNINMTTDFTSVSMMATNAMMQSGIAYLTLPTVAASNPLGAIGVGKSVSKATKQISAMAKLVAGDMIKGFKEQRAKIKAYTEASNSVESLSDPTLRDIPGISEDVLVLTDEEYAAQTAALEREQANYQDVDVEAALYELEAPIPEPETKKAD